MLPGVAPGSTMIRRTTILSVAVVIAALLACSDRPTAPGETVLSAAATKTARFELASAPDAVRP